MSPRGEKDAPPRSSLSHTFLRSLSRDFTEMGVGGGEGGGLKDPPKNEESLKNGVWGVLK